MGAFTPVAAIGALFISIKYMLSKGFVVQGAYNDKTFFTTDLVLLITMAGQAYGLDAVLRRYVPAPVCQALIGEQPAPAVAPQPQPAPA